MNPHITSQTPSKHHQHTTPFPQPSKRSTPLSESEAHKTTLEAAKLHRRRLEHAVLLSALRSRVPHSSIPGLLASVSGVGAGENQHSCKQNYGYKHHYTYTYIHHFHYNYSYEPGYRNVYAIPGVVLGGMGSGQARVLDDSFLRRAYKRRDLVRKRKASSGSRSSGRGSVGSGGSSASVLEVNS